MNISLLFAHSVEWAQRSSDSEADKNFIYLKIEAADVPNDQMTLDLQSTGLTFKGYSNSKKATYAVSLEFYAEVDPAKSPVHHSARDVELKLQKKNLDAKFWPRLLKDTKKMHFLKTDFDKVSSVNHATLQFIADSSFTTVGR